MVTGLQNNKEKDSPLANGDTQLKEIDSYGISKPDVKGIVGLMMPCIRQVVSESRSFKNLLRV